MISTDYTGKDSLKGALLNKYRFSHWLVDILRNFMSDPINIKDERLCKLLLTQDGSGVDECRALFKVEAPFTADTRKACTTPAIFVSAGATEYPVRTFNALGGDTKTLIGAKAAYSNSVLRKMAGNIAVITESCDGTQLLAGLIEDFLVVNAFQLQQDGMVSQLSVTGSSETKRIVTGEAANAKDVYQIVIGITAIGGISWTTDTQGPVYRGITLAPLVK